MHKALHSLRGATLWAESAFCRASSDTDVKDLDVPDLEFALAIRAKLALVADLDSKGVIDGSDSALICSRNFWRISSSLDAHIDGI